MERIVSMVFENAPLPLYAISLALHSLGIYLLTIVQQKSRTQDAIFVNLSIAEIFMSCCDLTQNILSRSFVHPLVIDYLTIIQCALFVIPSIWIMTLLALNRFLEVYLNIKYNLMVNRKKMRILLVLFWVVGILTAFLLVFLRSKYERISTTIYKFLLPINEGCFFFIAVVSYSYIWRKISVQRTKTRRRMQQFHAQQKEYLRKNFFPPFLIIVSFITFVLIPDILNLIFVHTLKLKEADLIKSILLVFYVTGFICDALIYIFFQPHVTRLLFYKLRVLSDKTGVSGKDLLKGIRKRVESNKTISSLNSDTSIATLEKER